MAKFYKRSDGTFGFRRDAGDVNQLPADVIDFVVFDEETNAATCADISANTSLYSVVSGVLKKSGANVTIAADGNKTGLMKAAAAAIQNNTDFLAIATPTNAQTLAQVKALSQQNTKIIKRILQLSQ